MSATKTHPQHDKAAEQQALLTSKSKGERLFDTLTYGVINGIGTFAVTIPIAYSIKYGKGAKHSKGATEFLLKKSLSPGVAEEMVNTTALMQGGNAAILPVKMMENYKPQIVDKFNDLLGDKSGKASVQDDHKQSWMSLIKGRVVAWVAVFSGFRAAAMIAGPEKMQAFENKSAEITSKLLRKPTHIFDAKTKAFSLAEAEKMAANLAGNGKMAERLIEAETKAFRYGKIGAMDAFATAAATVILYVSSRYFAKKNPSWNIIESENAKKAAAAAQNDTQQYPASIQNEPVKTRFTDNITSRSNADKVQPAQGYENSLIQQRQSDEKNAPTLAV